MLLPKLRNSANRISVVANGAMAVDGIADGRMIPHLILDTRKRPDISEFIRLHRNFGAGDVESQWGEVLGQSNRIILRLDFLRPAKIDFEIEFEMSEHSGTIDLIMQNRAVYIQAGVPGEVLSQDVNKDKVIVEVPDNGSDKRWERKMYRHLRKRYKDSGLGSRQAENAAERQMVAWRKLGLGKAGVVAKPEGRG